MAVQELRWLTYLLTDLGEPPRSPPVLYVDNKAMLALCREHRLEHRTKHIALRYFLARELLQCGQLRLAYVASEANTADIFTKALPPGDHQRFCTMLGFLYVPTCFLVQSFLILSHRCRGLWYEVGSFAFCFVGVDFCRCNVTGVGEVGISFGVDAFARIFVVHRDRHGAVWEWSCFVRGVIHVLLVPVSFVGCGGEGSITTEATCGIPIFFQVGKICRKGESFVENDITCCYCFFGVDVENLPRVVIPFDAQV
ncbi:unnamed protein product [Closterium sp. NIES-54]